MVVLTSAMNPSAGIPLANFQPMDCSGNQKPRCLGLEKLDVDHPHRLRAYGQCLRSGVEQSSHNQLPLLDPCRSVEAELIRKQLYLLPRSVEDDASNVHEFVPLVVRSHF